MSPDDQAKVKKMFDHMEVIGQLDMRKRAISAVRLIASNSGVSPASKHWLQKAVEAIEAIETT